MDRLGRAKETAQVASAIGREFELEVIRAVSPLVEAEVDEDLEALVAAELLYRRRRLKKPTFLFKHALIRDAAYESMLRRTRREVHGRIARTLEKKFPAMVNERPDILARHHAAAEQMAEAVEYGQRAAMEALRQTSHAEADAHATRVVGWLASLETGARVVAELRANGVLTQVRMAQRGWADPEVKAAIDRSTMLLGDLGEDAEHRVPTLWALFTYHHTASNRRESREAAETLVRIAATSGDAGMLAAATMVLGLAGLVEGKYDEAVASFTRSIDAYDPTRHRDHATKFGLDSLVLARTSLACARCVAGDARLAYELVTEGVAWARELNHVPSLAMGLLYACQCYHFNEDKASTGAAATEILALAKKYGLPAFQGYASLFQAWATGDTTGTAAIASGSSMPSGASWD